MTLPLITDTVRGAFDEERSAVFSLDRRYRYRLSRRWDDGDTVCFVMLNPSSADAFLDDPTIRRCLDYAKRWDYGRLEVVNLFAWRSTHAKALLKVGDPVGRYNDSVLENVIALSRPDLVVAAWGALDKKLRYREQEVLAKYRFKFHVLAKTEGGHPRHPLYCRKDLSLIPWEDA